MDKKASALLGKAFTAPVVKRHYFHSCIGNNGYATCTKDRLPGEPFCKEHKDRHDKSPWVKAWREYQKEVRRVGVKNAVWSPPKKEVKK